MEKSNMYPSVYLRIIWDLFLTVTSTSNFWLLLNFYLIYLWLLVEGPFSFFHLLNKYQNPFFKILQSAIQIRQFRRQLRVTDLYCWFGECLHWVTAQLIRLILDIHFLKSSLAILLLRTSPFVAFPWMLFPSFSFHLCTAQRRDIPLSCLSLKIKFSSFLMQNNSMLSLCTVVSQSAIS